MFKTSLLRNYSVKYYDYIVKWCSGRKRAGSTTSRSGPANRSLRLKPWHTTAGVERTDEEVRHDAPLRLFAELREQGKARQGNVQWYSMRSVCIAGYFKNYSFNSTCIRTNQNSKGIIYSAVLSERIRRQRRNTRTIG